MRRNVKKSILVVGAVGMMLFFVIGCESKKDEVASEVISVPEVVNSEKEGVTAIENPSIEDYEEITIGSTETDIHEKFGEPIGTLSGFYGDIYVTEEKRIVVYYELNANSEYAVSEVKIEAINRK